MADLVHKGMVLKWLKDYVFRSAPLQEQGYTRSHGSIVASDEVWEGLTGGLCGAANAKSVLGIPGFKRALEILVDKFSLCKTNIFIRKDDDGREFHKKHPWWKAITSQANAYLTPKEIKKQALFDAKMTGNGYVYANRQNFTLWNLDPGSVTPVILHQPTEQTFFYKVNNWQGGTIILNDFDVLHLKGMGNQCGLVGLSCLDYARTLLETNLDTINYGSNFFKFGGLSDTWVELSEDVPLTPEAEQEMLKRLKRNYGGQTNTHSPIVLRGGKLNRDRLNNSDAQFLESKTFSLLEMGLLIGINPALIGYRDGNTSYNSLLADREDAASTTYEPIISQWDDQCNLKLRTEAEKDADEIYFETDRTDLIRGDTKSELEMDIIKLSNGVMSREEFRRKHNLSVTALETEEFFIPTNLVSSKAPPPPAPAPFGGEAPPADKPTDKETEEKE